MGLMPDEQRLFHRNLRSAFLLPLFLMAALAVVLLWQIVSLISVTHWLDESDQVIFQQDLIQDSVGMVRADVRTFLLTGAPADLQAFEQNSNPIKSEMDRLAGMVANNPPQFDRVQKCAAAFRQWHDSVDSWLRMPDPNSEAARDIGRAARTESLNSMEDNLMAFRDAERQLRQDRTRDVRRDTWTVVGVAVLGSLVLGIFLAISSRRSLRLVSHSYRTALEKADHRLQRILAVQDISRAIISSGSAPEICDRVLVRLHLLARYYVGMILLPDGDRLPIVARQMSPQLAGKIGSLLSESDYPAAEFDPAGAVKSTVIAIPGYGADGAVSGLTRDEFLSGQCRFAQLLESSGARSILSAPIVLKSGRGRIALACTDPTAFDDEVAGLVADVASQLGLVLQRLYSAEIESGTLATAC
jgi:CHASE3 domain sensor protein